MTNSQIIFFSILIAILLAILIMWCAEVLAVNDAAPVAGLKAKSVLMKGELNGSTSQTQKYIGIDEDADEDKVLEFAQQAGTPIESSETPWCAIFVNAMLAMCGLKTTGTMRARDFADWGQKCEERIGAIVVYKSHVGFVPEPGKVLGGNQSDGVNIGEQR